jgi:hypothetical protein
VNGEFHAKVTEQGLDDIIQHYRSKEADHEN